MRCLAWIALLAAAGFIGRWIRVCVDKTDTAACSHAVLKRLHLQQKRFDEPRSCTPYEGLSLVRKQTAWMAAISARSKMRVCGGLGGWMAGWAGRWLAGWLEVTLRRTLMQSLGRCWCSCDEARELYTMGSAVTVRGQCMVHLPARATCKSQDVGGWMGNTDVGERTLRVLAMLLQQRFDDAQELCTMGSTVTGAGTLGLLCSSSSKKAG